ncbi:MAG: DinB family protein [Acidobacteriota bacterium]
MRPLLWLVVAAPLVGQTITPEERQTALTRLRSSRKLFLAAIAGISEAQWNFKPAPDRWSVGECAEHIVLTEQAYYRTLTRLLESTPAAGRRADLSDEELLKLYTDRSQKRQAPEPLQPKGRWAGRRELIERFNGTRDRIIALAQTTGLPLRNYTSPAAGGKLMDGYQWFLRIAGHAERHTAQLEEVKADPKFPQ